MEGQVGKMFVVDGVELVVSDELEQMRELDGDHAFGTQQRSQARNKIVEVRDMVLRCCAISFADKPAQGFVFTPLPSCSNAITASASSGSGRPWNAARTNAGSAARPSLQSTINLAMTPIRRVSRSGEWISGSR